MDDQWGITVLHTIVPDFSPLLSYSPPQVLQERVILSQEHKSATRRNIETRVVTSSH